MQKEFSPDAPLVLVGCGHMGRALALGWLKAGLAPEALFVVDPAAGSGAIDEVPASHFAKSANELPVNLVAKAVVLAVKPQIMNSILPGLRPLINTETMIVSIAAGVTIDQMQRGIDKPAVYIRAMPNTPAAVGEGITGVTALKGVSEGDKKLACSLMEATGHAVWIDEESQMDAVTAVSGSGPAYVFYMVECMAAAGVKAGLSSDVAMALARQTIIGAGQLMRAEGTLAADELRKRVTSPGGTTAAALDVLMAEDGLSKLMKKAVGAAKSRGKELAG